MRVLGLVDVVVDGGMLALARCGRATVECYSSCTVFVVLQCMYSGICTAMRASLYLSRGVYAVVVRVAW